MGGLISRLSITPSQGAGTQRSYFFGVPFYLCVHTLTKNYQISHGNTRRWRLFSGGEPHLYRSGRGPSAPQIWGFLSIYGYALLPQNYQI